jgi:uncharacterized protein (TIGR02145 family)
MQKSTLMFILTLGLLQTQAQDYLISFAGAGASTSVNTVKVDNLTSGATVTLNGGDILHLKAALGIQSPDLNNNIIKIYPNPMVGQSLITFVAPENGDVDICLVDMVGKTVYQINKVLSPGSHSFRISGVKEGMYSVKVSGHSYSYSAKLISQCNSQRAMGIEHVSSDKNTPGDKLKSATATINMQYTNGDQLHYKGISGIYSTIVTDVPTSSKTTTFNFVACTDADGNNYSTVQIGAGKSVLQTWMAENLNVGIQINGNVEQTQNAIIEKYCYNEDEANCAIYGGLYEWNEMMQYASTSGVKGICPTGWHLPTDEDWATVVTILGGESVAGGKMKSTGTIEAGTGLWNSPNNGATNESGFTTFPAGFRASNGVTCSLGLHGYWWSSSQSNSDKGLYQHVTYLNSSINRDSNDKTYGLSARCIKD